MIGKSNFEVSSNSWEGNCIQPGARCCRQLQKGAGSAVLHRPGQVAQPSASSQAQGLLPTSFAPLVMISGARHLRALPQILLLCSSAARSVFGKLWKINYWLQMCLGSRKVKTNGRVDVEGRDLLCETDCLLLCSFPPAVSAPLLPPPPSRMPDKRQAW